MTREIRNTYGDSVEEVIAQKEGLLQLMAYERDADDDAVQEARIALWEVMQERPDAPPAYLHAAARMRMTEFVVRGKATGAASMRGKSRPPLGPSLDDPDVLLQVESAEVLQAMQDAALEGEVARALEALTPAQRKYVELRFWQGADRNRLKEEFGYDPNGIWRGVKPKLAQRLEHLVPA